MRIRRRAQPRPASPPPHPSPPPDPSPKLPPLPTGRLEAWEEEAKRSGARERGVGEGLRGLHPDGDLPIDSHPWASTKDPTPAQGSQGVVGEKKLELELEVEANNKLGSAQVNSNKRTGGSYGEGDKDYDHPNKRVIGYDNGDWRGGSDQMQASKERKASRTKARGNATAAPNTFDDSIGACTEKKSDVVVNEEREGGGGKKRRSPAVLMEGSRCSRVNGRGWRCCQQTLVGYSLCEHHLGKGRLRSMSSVRGQLGTSKPSINADIANQSKLSSSSQQEQQQLLDANKGNDDDKDEKKKKRKKKIGMMKARSMSSLLDETNNHSVESPAAAAQAQEAAVEPPADAINAMV